MPPLSNYGEKCDMEINVKNNLRKTALSIALIFIVPLSAFGQKWCTLPVGGAVQSAMYTDTKPLLPWIAKLAGTRKFVVLRKPTKENLQAKQAFEEGYLSAAYVAGRSGELAKNGQKFTDQQLHDLEPQLKKMASKDLDQISSGSDLDGLYTAYVYSNAEDFQKSHGTAGATIDGDADDFKKLLVDNYGAPPRFFELIENWGTKLIFISGFELSEEFIDKLPVDYTVIKLPGRAGAPTNLYEIATQSNPSNSVVFFGLPTNTAEAVPWGFDKAKATRYAKAGSGTLRELKKAGVEFVSLLGLDPKQIAEKATAYKAHGKHIIVLGEGANNGASIRLPGSHLPFILADHGDTMGGASLIFCNSAGSTISSTMSIVGRVYVDEATRDDR